MAEAVWAKVDAFVAESLQLSDPALDAALADSAAAGLPAIQVTANQGRFLQVLARLCAARRILEIGTLGGYSTIWLARALAAGGRLVTIEVDPRHAAVARVNIARAGLTDRVEQRIGAALDVLPQLVADSGGPFDFVFIDADKPSTPAYFEWSLRLTRVGGVIVVDNVVRKGALVDANSADESVRGVRRLLERMGAEPRVQTTVLQTVGGKGYDGMAIALVVA